MQEINILSAPRSPTHQIQIYNQYGQFVRKFGANILQHPRGVCVDNKGRIIVVECKVQKFLLLLKIFCLREQKYFPRRSSVMDKRLV